MSIDATLMKKFQNLQELHVPFAAATNMPFVTCDEETFNDQIWIFSSLETATEFCKKYAEQKIVLRDIIVKKEFLGDFFMDLHSMGINELVFCDGADSHKIEFSKFVKIPDFSKLPKNQQPLLNPELQLSTIYFFQEVKRPGVAPDKEKLEPLAEEMYVNLAKAKFLLPVVRKETEDKKEALIFPILTDKNGNKFQPVFSDHQQYAKHLRKNKPKEEVRTLLAGIQELQKYLLPQVQGYLLNPDGYCHALTPQLLKTISEQF